MCMILQKKVDIGTYCRCEVDSKKKKEIRPFSRWLWEDEFKLWTTENGIGNQHQ